MDSQSGTIDLGFTRNCWPYTSFDVSYTYYHLSGSSPGGTTQSGDQHVGFIRVLQPLEPFWPHCDNWRPITLNADPSPDQFAVILAAGYGGNLVSTQIPRFPSISSTAYTYVGSALLDYQRACFPKRTAKYKWRPCHKDATSYLPDPDDNYPSLLFDFSSGIQFNTTRLVSSNPAFAGLWSGRQLTYQNIGSLTYSLRCRLGFLVGAEWDAPLSSDPLHGAQAYHANTAIFTGGIVYNLFPEDKYDPSDKAASQERTGLGRLFSLRHRLSLSLLYSYTAFDPFAETNQLQFQGSISF
jgi:hypothetical protein